VCVCAQFLKRLYDVWRNCFFLFVHMYCNQYSISVEHAGCNRQRCLPHLTPDRSNGALSADFHYCAHIDTTTHASHLYIYVERERERDQTGRGFAQMPNKHRKAGNLLSSQNLTPHKAQLQSRAGHKPKLRLRCEECGVRDTNLRGRGNSL
jgi:hypothetical protein